MYARQIAGRFYALFFSVLLPMAIGCLSRRFRLLRKDDVPFNS